MHDSITAKSLSDKQLQDLIMSISQKMNGVSPSNEATYELLQKQIDVFRMELEERQLIEMLKQAPLPTMNLTTDPLSEIEDLIEKGKSSETKPRQQNN